MIAFTRNYRDHSNEQGAQFELFSVDQVAAVNMAAQQLAACPHCGARVQGGKFCASCGEPLTSKLACAKCGAEFSGKFCPECRTPAST